MSRTCGGQQSLIWIWPTHPPFVMCSLLSLFHWKSGYCLCWCWKNLRVKNVVFVRSCKCLKFVFVRINSAKRNSRHCHYVSQTFTDALLVLFTAHCPQLGNWIVLRGPKFFEFAESSKKNRAWSLVVLIEENGTFVQTEIWKNKKDKRQFAEFPPMVSPNPHSKELKFFFSIICLFPEESTCTAPLHKTTKNVRAWLVALSSIMFRKLWKMSVTYQISQFVWKKPDHWSSSLRRWKNQRPDFSFCAQGMSPSGANNQSPRLWFPKPNESREFSHSALLKEKAGGCPSKLHVWNEPLDRTNFSCIENAVWPEFLFSYLRQKFLRDVRLDEWWSTHESSKLTQNAKKGNETRFTTHPGCTVHSQLLLQAASIVCMCVQKFHQHHQITAITHCRCGSFQFQECLFVHQEKLFKAKRLRKFAKRNCLSTFCFSGTHPPGLLWFGGFHYWIVILTKRKVVPEIWTDCKLQYFLFYVCKHVSSSLLVAMSIDRWVSMLLISCHFRVLLETDTSCALCQQMVKVVSLQVFPDLLSLGSCQHLQHQIGSTNICSCCSSVLHFWGPVVLYDSSWRFKMSQFVPKLSQCLPQHRCRGVFLHTFLHHDCLQLPHHWQNVQVSHKSYRTVTRIRFNTFKSNFGLVAWNNLKAGSGQNTNQFLMPSTLFLSKFSLPTMQWNF